MEQYLIWIQITYYGNPIESHLANLHNGMRRTYGRQQHIDIVTTGFHV